MEMGEDLLHFIWKYGKLAAHGLHASGGAILEIVSPGSHNLHSGPDFFDARIRINGQLWAGNVEIHVRSSDWYAHGHERDPKYENVILHVVWEDDCAVFRADGSMIPVLELKNVVPSDLVGKYRELMGAMGVSFINCEREIAEVPKIHLDHWLERLYVERLEVKAGRIAELLKGSNNDWEAVLYQQLLVGFGLKINGAAFKSLASALPFTLVRKLGSEPHAIESLLFGLSGLLDGPPKDRYQARLAKEYSYLAHKFALSAMGVLRPEFFKLRPPNFPTIRLSQFANLYGKHSDLFDRVIRSREIALVREAFQVTASTYWNDHYTFGKPTPGRPKRITRPFVDLLLINTVVPIRFCYARSQGHDAPGDAMRILEGIPAEVNATVQRFGALGLPIDGALNSQALLQLHSAYCSRNKCLDCAIGERILRGNG